jgi:hypothetical protein
MESAWQSHGYTGSSNLGLKCPGVSDAEVKDGSGERSVRSSRLEYLSEMFCISRTT